jgi:hypothetical protein
MLPEKDVELVRKWAEAKTPPELRDRMRVEIDMEQRSLTIVEWSLMGDQWLSVPAAKLLWTGRTNVWTLYRFDSNSKPHRYEFLEPSPRVQDLLDEVDDDPTFIFWG